MLYRSRQGCTQTFVPIQVKLHIALPSHNSSDIEIYTATSPRYADMLEQCICGEIQIITPFKVYKHGYVHSYRKQQVQQKQQVQYKLGDAQETELLTRCGVFL